MKEDSIIDIILKYISEDYINELYEKRAQDFDLIIEKDMENIPINFRVALKFSNDLFDEFADILYQNALEWAVANKDIKFLLAFKTNKNNFKNFISDNILVKAKITQLGIKNIFKKQANENYVQLINTLKDKYKTIFNTLAFKEVDTIINKVRKILIMFFETFDEENFNNAIEELLYSTKHDDYIISISDGLVDKKSITILKKIVKLIILEDNFIILTFARDDQSIPYYEETEDEEDLLEYENNIDEDILDFIDECIDNKHIELPVDNVLKDEMYDNFFNYLYTSIHDDFKEEYKDTDEMKKLKKIDPFFDWL